MYLILKRINSSENVWSFYTEGGILWTSEDNTETTLKLRQLIMSTPASELRLVQQIEFDVDAFPAFHQCPTVPPTEPDPDPGTGSTTPTDPDDQSGG